MSRPAMRNLPIELVGVVVENVTSTSDLLSLRSVNSTYLHLATPRLFRTVHIRNSIQSAQKCQNILTCPSLATHVNEVVYDRRDHAQFCLLPPGAEGACDELEIAELEDVLTETFCSLPGFKHLESVVINFWPSFRSESGSEIQEHPFWFTQRQVTVLHAVHHAIKSSCIRSLTLNNVVLTSSTSYDFVSSVTDSPLHHFSMSIVANSELGVWSGSKALNGSLSALLPTSNANLKSLVLRSPQGLCHSPNTQLRTCHYPALETLVLENIVFDPAPSADGIEEFIIGHKTSLRRLKLDSCSSYVPSLTIPVRTWPTIWKRLEEELVCLEELEISGVHHAYALLEGARGYVRHPSVSAPLPEEVEALYSQLGARVKLRA